LNLSIVTGSVRRLGPLQQMVTSVRATVPVGITYEILIVGVADDGATANWCAAQQDVRLIQQPGLLGAIRAFDEGAAAAQGEYVILANDDVVFAKGAIPRALLHMERTPTCGAVAFADDRPGPSKHRDTLGFGVQLMKAQQHNAVVYACVGMFRKWLGDLAGWWGSEDPIMREGHTYGGDTYLSARLWELGYTVDWVAECRVKDLIHEDGLRETNRQAEAANPGVYYRRFPNGPKVAPAPLVGPPDAERLRVLYLPIYEPGAYYAVQKAGKRGLREAFGKYGLVWEIDYINQSFDLVNTVKLWQPDLLFLQLHSAVEITGAMVAECRRIKPDMAIVNWNGDVYAEHLTSTGILDILKHADVQLCINATVFPNYEEHGVKVRYWQCAPEPVDEANLPDAPHHDVLLLANAYSPARKAWGDTVVRELGSAYDVAIYGSGWGGKERGNTTYNFAGSFALTKNATITIGDNQWHGDGGFVSNRFFEALSAGGAIMLHQQVPSLERFTGYQAGVHYVEWTDHADMIEKAREWLHPDKAQERAEMAARAQAFTREHHSFEARVDQLLNEILPDVLS
jgi:hypothetical protein